MANAYIQENQVWKLDSVGTVAATGKKLAISKIIYIGVTAGNDFTLTDGADKEFLSFKATNTNADQISFTPPRLVNGLKLSVIDAGTIYVYLG
jgi:hypothetical protein